MFIFGYVVRLDVSFIMDGADQKKNSLERLRLCLTVARQFSG
jgi:hypothetical protein